MATIRTSCFEGMELIRDSGMPATLDFTLVEELLAVDPDNPDPGELNQDSVFADLTEITGTGFARVNKAVVAPVAGEGFWSIATAVEWDTGAATDWPAVVPTIAVLIPTTDEIVGLWDAAYYLNGGDPIDMSVADAVLSVAAPLELFMLPVSEIAA